MRRARAPGADAPDPAAADGGAWRCQADSRPAEETAKPELALLSSLPIAFGESFGLEQQRSPLLEDLEASFRVTPVDGPEQLKPGGCCSPRSRKR
jgi:hypothetical protein